MGYCRVCGYELGELRFCGQCGSDSWAPMTAPPMQAPPTAVPVAAAPPAPGFVGAPLPPPPPPQVAAYGYGAPVGYAPRTIWSLRGLSTAALWLYGATAFAAGLVGLTLLNAYGALETLDDQGTRAARQAYLDAAAAHGAMSLLYLLGVIATGIVTIIWLWRAVSNLPMFPNPPLRKSPGWAIGGWFIPIAAWFIPKGIIDDVWRGAAVDGTGGRPWNAVRVPAVINLWWAGWVAGSIVSTIGNSMSGSDEIGTVESGLLVSAFGAGLIIAGAVFAIVSIQQITKRHHDAALALGLPAR